MTGFYKGERVVMTAQYQVHNRNARLSFVGTVVNPAAIRNQITVLRDGGKKPQYWPVDAWRRFTDIGPSADPDWLNPAEGGNQP